jgi:hypothetical protein
MSYKDGLAKRTGHLGEKECDEFLKENGFISVKPTGPDNGIDRIVSLKEYPNKSAKIQVKGRSQVENPRWFQLTVPRVQLRNAYAIGQDLNQLWKKRIFMVDFWILISIPNNEIWIFPSQIIYQIAEANFIKYHTRRDNNYSQVNIDKNGRVEMKHKELNLDIFDTNGIQLFKKYKEYINNISLIHDFLNQ